MIVRSAIVPVIFTYQPFGTRNENIVLATGVLLLSSVYAGLDVGPAP